MGRRKKNRANRTAPPADRVPSRVNWSGGRIAVVVVGVALLLGVWLAARPASDRGDSPTTSTPIDRDAAGPAAVGATTPAATGGSSRVTRVVAAGKETGDEADWQQVDDPDADGWTTEAQHRHIKSQLKRLGKAIVVPAKRDSYLGKLVDEDFVCSRLVPTPRVTVHRTPLLTVERAAEQPHDSGAANTSAELAVYRGAAGLATALDKDFPYLTDAPTDEESPARYEFKVVGIRPAGADGLVHTEQLFSLFAPRASGNLEQHATWHMTWRFDVDDDQPRLQSIDVDDFEQSTVARSTPLLVDCTQAALAADPCYDRQLAYGANHWLERIPFRTMLNLFSMPGVAVGDVNGDGRDDLYLCQDPGLPNRLFLQQDDGTLRDVAADWGVDWIEDARSALLVDLDNDGDQDLVVAIRAGLVIAANDAGRRFELHDVLPINEDATSLAAADYDADGRLDIYVCIYQPNELLKTSTGASMGAARPQFVLHDANNAAPNHLFRNVGTDAEPLTFVEVTREVGLDANNRRWSLAAAWEDFDNDGDVDLYVANDYGRDNLYRNDAIADGERVFVDVGDEAAVESSAAGMAVAWGDYDRDGQMDAYISNMFSSAGSRVTTQRAFKPDASAVVRDRLRHFASGNTLLRNRGDGTFANASEAAGVAMGRWAWGNAFVDLDNDGWEDLAVVNGYMTTEDTGDL